MGNAIFPSNLPGVTLNTTLTPRFSTRVQSAISGRETRAGFMAYPKWDITFNFDVLRSNEYLELQKMVAFFLQMRGQLESFLVSVPEDNKCVDMKFGTGNGLVKTFQITRTFGDGEFGFVEPVQNINSITNVKINGVITTDYSVDSTGYLVFNTAPAANSVITWTGTYFYRCRFAQDSASFDRFLNQLWELKKVQLIGAPGNKV